MSEGESQLLVRALTWEESSHNLFNYELTHVTSQDPHIFTIRPLFVFIYRESQGDTISCVCAESLSHHRPAPGQLLAAFRIQPHPLRLRFYSPNQIKAAEDSASAREAPPSQAERIYLIVRSIKSPHHPSGGLLVKPGDFLKFGRLEYRVATLCAGKDSIWRGHDETGLCESVDEGECRYCLDSAESGNPSAEDSFLCTPCGCKGSSKPVHFRCLRRWVQSKVKKEVSGGTVQYSFSSLACEVCLQPYPRFIKHQSALHELVPLAVEGPLVLASVGEKQQSVIFFERMRPEGVRIGRGTGCDIRLADRSVSREHALLQSTPDGLVLSDCRSKFGTLVSSEEP